MNEKIQLDKSVKVRTEIMQEYLDGKAETQDPHKVLRQQDEKQQIINEDAQDVFVADDLIRENVAKEVVNQQVANDEA